MLQIYHLELNFNLSYYKHLMDLNGFGLGIARILLNFLRNSIILMSYVMNKLVSQIFIRYYNLKLGLSQMHLNILLRVFAFLNFKVLNMYKIKRNKDTFNS